jgi:hypothetical protein
MYPRDVYLLRACTWNSTISKVFVQLNSIIASPSPLLVLSLILNFLEALETRNEIVLAGYMDI